MLAARGRICVFRVSHWLSFLNFKVCSPVGKAVLAYQDRQKSPQNTLIPANDRREIPKVATEGRCKSCKKTFLQFLQ